MARLYDAWPGTNRFLRFGCIMGPLKDFCANMYFYACVVIVLVPYGIWMFRSIWNISPVIPLLFFGAIAITTVFLNLTQCTDPGIIPRRPFLLDDPDKFEKYLAEPMEG